MATNGFHWYNLGMATTLASRIELWPLDRLRPYERNARLHSAEQVAKIAASIAEFGFLNPILVDTADGIIAGHGRMEAAQRLGLAEVPVIVLDHLSDAQRRAYIIADNRLAEDASWDRQLLAEELHDIEEDGLDVGLIGFSDEELAELMDGLRSGPLDDEKAGDDDDEPIDGERYALAVVLNYPDYQRWKAIKAGLGATKDTTAFLKLLEQVDSDG